MNALIQFLTICLALLGSLITALLLGRIALELTLATMYQAIPHSNSKDSTVGGQPPRDSPRLE